MSTVTSCVRVIAVLLTFTSCSSFNEPPKASDTTAAVLDGTQTDPTDVCTGREPYHPDLTTLVIEVAEGPPVGIDAAQLTQACSGDFFYGVGIDFFTNAAGDVPPLDVLEVLSEPDATSGGCTSGYFVMSTGDVLGITLEGSLAPNDVLNVVAVEPDGTCSPAATTNHLKLSIADGIGTQFPIGQGTVATVPSDLLDSLP